MEEFENSINTQSHLLEIFFQQYEGMRITENHVDAALRSNLLSEQFFENYINKRREAEETLTNLIDNVDKIISSYDGFTDEFHDGYIEIQNKDRLVNNLKNQIKRKHNEYCKLDSIKRKLEGDIAKLDNTDQFEKLKKFNLELIRKNSELTTSNGDLKTKLEGAECRFEVLKTDKRKHKCEIKTLKKSEEAKTVQLIELTTKINRLEAQTAELNQTKRQLKTNETLFTEKIQKLTKTEADLTEFKKQLSNSRMNNVSEKNKKQEQKLKTKITELENENCELKQQKSIILVDSKARIVELDRKNVEVLNLRGTNKNLEKLIDDLLKPRIETLKGDRESESKFSIVDNNNNDLNSSKIAELEKVFVNMKSNFENFGAALKSMKVCMKCDLCGLEVSKSEKQDFCSHKFCDGCFSKSQCNICYKPVQLKVSSFPELKTSRMKNQKNK